MSDDVRIIKKYPNRRLYDTTISSYITLQDIRQLVMDQIEFKVIDAKSSEDLTRTILLQIISEQEEAGNPIFSSEMLSQFIRIYGDEAQNAFTDYLNRSLHLFIEQYSTFSKQMGGMAGQQPPANPFAQMAEQNLEAWKNIQEGMFKMTQNWGQPYNAEPPSKPKDGDKES